MRFKFQKLGDPKPVTRDPSSVSEGNQTRYFEPLTWIPPFRGLWKTETSASGWWGGEGKQNCAHIESFCPTPNVATLRDIVETCEALLVQKRVKESESGQPNAQPIIIQEGD
jgi:hypothetical protein